MDYSPVQFSSDLDAYRSDGTVYTTSITMSGNILGGASQTQTSLTVDVPDADFFQATFDNSIEHSGRYRDIFLEPSSWVLDTTSGIYFNVILTLNITSAGELTFTGQIVNTTASTLTLQSTTINFRIVVYDSTLL